MTDRYKSRASTHADGCWSWGPKHYECAIGKIERDEALLRQALEALKDIRSRSAMDLVIGLKTYELIALLAEIHYIAGTALAKEDKHD